MVKFKGMTINILSVGLIILVSVILYAFLNPLSQPHSSEYAKTDIYVMKNALDSSKVYLRASFDYAVYQALYDVSRKGGFSDAQSQSAYANALAPVISCQKTDKRIGEPEKIIGCVPGEYGCPDSDGKDAYINEGYQVGLLQFLLKDLKYELTVDCKFGKGSLEKLKEFQKDKGLTESGFLDDATTEKLKESFAYDNCGDYFYGCTNSFSAVWSTELAEDQFKSNIKNEIVKNMNSYTSKGYVFLDLPITGLPQYKTDKITISESGTGLKVSLSGDNIKISKKDEYEVIDIASSSDMEKIYDIDAFGIYRKAKSVYNDIKSKGCDAAKDETKTEGGFKTEVKIVSKTTNPECSAKVRVSVVEENPKKVPVFNGRSVSFEPVNMILMLNL
ncbi:MAG: peptidoglycan-binding domain-containing protein [Candidatus Aenigmarchaeota archaeon]|nr:peptidoglycan-binding domain-containing protein [Candidatus Aenigmarchaeota archaeon]